MNALLTLDLPRAATQEERATISRAAIARHKTLITSGEPDLTLENIAQQEAYYNEALITVYPIRDSTAQLSFVAGNIVPFFKHGQVFGWDYAVWLCTAQQQWKHLDYGDSQVLGQDV